MSFVEIKISLDFSVDAVRLELTTNRLKAECSNHLSYAPLAGVVGFEPTTNRLTAGRSTTELHSIDEGEKT